MGFGGVAAELFKKSADALVAGFAELKIHLKKISQGFLGDIIFGGAEPSGNKHYIGMLTGVVEGHDDVFVHIPYGDDTFDKGPMQIKDFTHPGRISIGDLANQNFIANGDNMYDHVLVVKWVRR